MFDLDFDSRGRLFTETVDFDELIFETVSDINVLFFDFVTESSDDSKKSWIEKIKKFFSRIIKYVSDFFTRIYKWGASLFNKGKLENKDGSKSEKVDDGKSKEPDEILMISNTGKETTPRDYTMPRNLLTPNHDVSNIKTSAFDIFMDVLKVINGSTTTLNGVPNTDRYIRTLLNDAYKYTGNIDNIDGLFSHIYGKDDKVQISSISVDKIKSAKQSMFDSFHTMEVVKLDSINMLKKIENKLASKKDDKQLMANLNICSHICAAVTRCAHMIVQIVTKADGKATQILKFKTE